MTIEGNRILLTRPQFELVTTDKQFPAMVAGFGSGKTGALIERCLLLKSRYPKQDVAYYLPTYDLVSTIGFPRLEEVLEERGAHYKAIKGQKPRIEIENGGAILFRNMDNPARIIGYEVADSLVDEIDTMKPLDAKAAWQKIVARNRQKKPDGSQNTVAVGTTPEGFRFVYDTWKKSPPSDDYHIIRASTYSNERNLPKGYIQTLLDLYPSNLVQAYIEGEFVNLTSGSVYPEFDRVLNYSPEVMISTDRYKEPLHIGLDFNVTKMSAVIFVQRHNNPVAVGELTGMFDTPATIVTIQSKFHGHPIFIYPDASGGARKSNNASVSDISLLQAAGFTVLNNAANPFVKDRVLAMNSMIFAGGKRRLLVNVDLCPSFTEGLEKQAYDKNGEPEKVSGLDHIVDAGGYHICYRYPVLGRGASRAALGGY